MIRTCSLHIRLHSCCFCRPLATKADGQDEPYRFFREFVGLNEDQIGTIRSGKALAKVVEATRRTRCLSSARFM